MVDRNRIREGMVVFSSEGEKLGKVLVCDRETFVIEKGFLFPKDYIARYEDVADIAGEDVRLTRTKDEFTREATMSGGRVGESSMLTGGGNVGEPASEAGIATSGRAEAREAMAARREAEGRHAAFEQQHVTRQAVDLEAPGVYPVIDEDAETKPNLGEDPGTIAPRRDEDV